MTIDPSLRAKEKHWCPIHKIYYRPHDEVLFDGARYEELPVLDGCPICIANEGKRTYAVLSDDVWRQRIAQVKELMATEGLAFSRAAERIGTNSTPLKHHWRRLMGEDPPMQRQGQRYV